MKTKLFSYVLPVAMLILFAQCGNNDGTDSFKESMDDTEEPSRDANDGPRDTGADTVDAQPVE
jgi:hypothetical protein